MNKLIIIALVACLSITACGRQKLTQIPQPPQGKQTETLQQPAPAPVSSIKWTATKWILRVGVMALLGWNWKEKVYYRAKANMSEKVITMLTAYTRDPNKQINPRDINIAYIEAFKAINNFIWKCESSEVEDYIELRELVHYFMIRDKGLSEDIKQINTDRFNQESIMVYPNKRERLWKFKQDVSGWMSGIIGKLMSRD
jgi:hypothetical protein